MRERIELTEAEVLRTLERHEHVVQDAARELDIAPATLAKRLRELGYERIIRWEKLEPVA